MIVFLKQVFNAFVSHDFWKKRRSVMIVAYSTVTQVYLLILINDDAKNVSYQVAAQTIFRVLWPMNKWTDLVFQTR